MRRVFLLIYRIVGNVADAQDLTQEAFIKALQRQDQLKDLEKAAHWLSRIASNTAIDFLRRAGRVSFSDLDELPEPLVSSRQESPEQRVLRTEHREHLEAGLDVLTDRERTALLLRDVEGSAGRRSRRAAELLEGDGALAHRQRAREAAEVFWTKKSMTAHVAETDLALYVSGDLSLWRSALVRLHLAQCDALPESRRRLPVRSCADPADRRGNAGSWKANWTGIGWRRR